MRPMPTRARLVAMAKQIIASSYDECEDRLRDLIHATRKLHREDRARLQAIINGLPKPERTT